MYVRNVSEQEKLILLLMNKMKLTVKDKEWNIIGTCDVEADKNLLDILTDNDIVVPASCKMWVCWVCLCTIEAGAELLIKKDVMPTEDDMCLLCTTYVNPELDWEIILKLVN
jgi:ferredoxin